MFHDYYSDQNRPYLLDNYTEVAATLRKYSKDRFIRTPSIRTQASWLRSAKNPLQASTGCPKHTR